MLALSKKLTIINVLLLFGCGNHEKTNLEEAAQIITKSDTIVISSVEQLNYFDTIQSLLEVVDINHVFNIYLDNNTSTVLPTIMSKKYFKPEIDGFYGAYNLLSIDGMPNGYIVVYSNSHPWNYNDPKDLPIEFTYYESDVKYFNVINVGMTEEELVSVLGNKFIELDNCVYYYNDHGMVAAFRLDSQKVVAIRIGQYSSVVRNGIIPSELLFKM